MAGTIAQAYVQILPSTRGITGNLQKELGGGMDAAGSKAGTSFGGAMKKAFVALGVGAAIGKVVKTAFSESSDYEQLTGGVEKIFGKSSGTIMKYAQNAYKSSGVSANQYMQQATSFSSALLQATGGNTKKTAETTNMAIKDMADNASIFGSNMEDIQNAYQGFAKQNYTMLDNLKLGYGGTKTEMERLLADAGKLTGQKYDISNLDDVYQAIHAIQVEQKITGNSAAEAAHTFSGSFDALKASWSNLMASLGQGDSALVQQSLQQVFESLGNFVPNLARMGISIIKGLGQSIVAASGQLSTFLSQSFSNMQPPDLTGMATSLASGIKTVFKNALNIGSVIIHAMANLAPKVLSGIAALFDNLTAYISGQGSSDIATAFSNAFVGVIKALPGIIMGVGKVITSALKLIFSLIGAAANALVTALVNAVASGFKALARRVSSALGGMPAAVASKFKAAASRAKAAVTSMASSVVSGFKSIPGKAAAALGSLVSKIRAPFDKAWNAVKGAMNKIKGIFPVNLGKILNLKLPHISVSGGKAPWGIAGKGSAPKFSVNWYAKGGIFDGPSVIGVGEAGPEAVTPIDKLQRYIGEAVGNSGGRSYNITVNVDGAENPEQWARGFVRSMEMELRKGV